MVKTRVFGVSHYAELETLKQLIAREAVIKGLCDVGGIGNDIVVEETSNYFYHFTITVADIKVTLTVSIGEIEHNVCTEFARLSSVKSYSDTPWCFGNNPRINTYDNPFAQMESLINHLLELHALLNKVPTDEKAKPNNR